MSETNNSADTFSFIAAAEGEGLDINAIFGNASVSGDINPFDVPEAIPVDTTPVVLSAPGSSPAALMTEALPDSAPQAQTSPVAENLLHMAFQQQEDENAQKGLFEKSPIFSYGSAREEIKDTSMTFEELRIAKSEDFPELSEGKRVSWSVEYGKNIKTITNPSKTTIASIKEEIERSKAFLDSLKKSKDKNPSCLIKPKVISQSKGIASYKGTFMTVEDARASDNSICLLPARNGKVYELRKTEMGEFIAPKNNITKFSPIRAGFTPALPLIPCSMMQQIISFFRYFMRENEEFEALVHIYWDKETKSFVPYVPHQQVYKAYLTADLQLDALSESRYLHYADVHSHNSMEAHFSPIDDQDELATRLYIVIGQLDQYFPSVSARMSCGGVFQNIDLSTIMEPLDGEFPSEWLDRIYTQGDNKKHCSCGCNTVLKYQERLQGLDPSFRYRLLNRLLEDCRYYLGAGNRKPEIFWTGEKEQQIALMKALWMSFPETDKPDWLSFHDIECYEADILGRGPQL